MYTLQLHLAYGTPHKILFEVQYAKLFLRSFDVSHVLQSLRLCLHTEKKANLI